MDAACPVPHVAHTTDSTETCSMSIVTNAGSGTVVPSGSRPTARRVVGKLIPPKTWCSSVLWIELFDLESRLGKQEGHGEGSPQ